VATVGGNALGFGDVTFSGIHDPVTWWGYNQQGGPGNHPRFFWELEGNFYDGVHTWAETYLQRYDTVPASGYRPFIVGTYDGFASAAFNVDQFSIANKASTVNPLYVDTATPSVIIGATTAILALGNNRYPYKQRNASGGGYVGLIGLNAADEVTIGDGNNLVSLGGALRFAGSPTLSSLAASTLSLLDANGVFTASVFQAGRVELMGNALVFNKTDATTVATLAPNGDLLRLVPTKSAGGFQIANAAGAVVWAITNPDATIKVQHTGASGYTLVDTFGGAAQSTIPMQRWYSYANVLGTSVNPDGTFKFALQTDFVEMTAPAAPAVYTARLYADDSGGKTRLMVLFNTGVAIQLAIQV
jgi:hypothetical protein